MPRPHLIELALRVDERDQLRVLLAWIHVEIVVRLWHARGSHLACTDPVPLVSTLDRGAELVTGVDEDIISPAVGVAIQDQRSLVETVHDPVRWNVLQCTAKPGEGGIQVGHVYGVAHNLSFFNDPRPPGEGRHTNAAFGEIALAATV